MKLTKLGPLIAAAFSLITSVSFADNGSVWRISKGENHLFVAGTVHMLRPSDFPLPNAYQVAFDQSDAAVFEADIDALSSPDTAAKAQALLYYPAGTKLSEQLEPDTKKQFDAYLSSKGLPSEQFEQMTPAAIVMTLTILELRKRGLTPNGVDAHFWQQASNKKMSKQWLESVEQQLSYLASYNKLPADEVVQQTLAEMAEVDALLEPMLKAWRSGDLEALDKTLLEDMRKEYPSIYQTLVTDRNNRWLIQLDTMLENKPVEIVLVGCLHLVGPDGLLTQLQAKGATVTRVISADSE